MTTERTPSEQPEFRPWPTLGAEDQWSVELMEELLEHTDQAPDELRARANELREVARDANLGQRDAALALADRYEQAASRADS